VQINYEQSLSETCVYRCRSHGSQRPVQLRPDVREREKLAATKNNYADWVHNLGIVRRDAKKDYVLDQLLSDSITPEMAQDIIHVFDSWRDDFSVVKNLMLSCMDPVLQKHYEQLSAFKIIKALNVLYHKQDSAEVHEITEAMENCNIHKDL
jgi:hypothetical protein